MERITRENITKHLIEYQLSLIGKDLLCTLDDDQWWFNNTMTFIQHEEFKKYAVKLIRKTFKCNKSKGEKTFEWFNGAFGLRIKN